MTDKLYQFAEIDLFLQYYSPRTPYGKREKMNRTFYRDSDSLSTIFELIDHAGNFIKTNPHKADKIEYHLGRIPELWETLKTPQVNSEIFNVKKFLHNYLLISTLLDKKTASLFSFSFSSIELLNKLGYRKDQEETFYLNDSCSPELKKIRADLRDLNRELEKIKEQRIGIIKEKTGLDFRFHDFLVIREEAIPTGSDHYIYIEPYDSRFVLLKPVMNHSYFHIYSSRKELLVREKEIERSIQSELINAIREDRDNIQKYIQSVTLLDIIFAKCRLSRRFQCTRPQINEDGHIHISQLEYIPLKEICISKQRPYSSLTAEFDNRNIVITGSNMGGKTILLKSVLFCQLLVQQGFFIPAGSVSTILFDAINLVGNLNDENSRGLSSFGEEIMNLIDSHHTSRSLYIVDEFARTTNSIEAYALNSALLQWFSECPHIYSFMSTHQENFPEFESVSNWSMKGLNYKKYKKYFHLDFDCDLEERIQLITDYMDYGVEPEKTGEIRRDALKIADILGLDSEILNYAEKYIKDQE